MANGTAKITRTFGTPTDRDKWTWSAWVKIADTQEQGLFFGYIDANNYTHIEASSTGQFKIYNHLAGVNNANVRSSNLMRDPSAFYHLVVVWDSGNATEADRVKMYINGVEIEYTSTTYPGQNDNSSINGNNLHEVGAKLGGYGFAGVMSHVQFVDGLALAPTDFGSFDSTSGIWKIKTSCYATPGNNGFCLKMEDSSNLDLDSSSNANTFTTVGTLTATKDNPSNNFATFNPLQNYIPAHTFSNGNDTITTTNASETYSMSTMGVSAGKWYFEALLDASTYSIYSQIGIAAAPGRATGDYIGQETWAYGTGFDNTGGYRQSGSATAYGNTWTGGDYLGCYMDLDNNKVYFAINGVIQNSGTGISITAAANTTGYGNYFFCIGERHSDDSIWYCNFGNGYFGTTAIGSPEEDAGGIGAFKYDPSSGTFDGSSKDFRALCTKNIKAYGG